MPLEKENMQPHTLYNLKGFKLPYNPLSEQAIEWISIFARYGYAVSFETSIRARQDHRGNAAAYEAVSMLRDDERDGLVVYQCFITLERYERNEQKRRTVGQGEGPSIGEALALAVQKAIEYEHHSTWTGTQRMLNEVSELNEIMERLYGARGRQNSSLD